MKVFYCQDLIKDPNENIIDFCEDLETIEFNQTIYQFYISLEILTKTKLVYLIYSKISNITINDFMIVNSDKNDLFMNYLLNFVQEYEIVKLNKTKKFLKQRTN